jgi:large subunit ribosomal protein L13
MNKEHTINAEGKSLGRVASEVAVLLMGKNTTKFARNVAPDVKVTIINANKVDVSVKKMNSKIYKNYSGYPGGLKESTMKKVVGDKGFQEIFRKAVYGMLPINKLRPVMIKNLTIQG